MKSSRHEYARVLPEDRRRADIVYKLLAALLVLGSAAVTIAVAVAAADWLGLLDPLARVLQ